MDVVAIILKLFGGLAELLKAAKSLRSSKKKGTAKLLLLELEHNIRLILDHYLNKQNPASSIIPLLKNREIKKALADNFDFSQIKKGKIKKSLIPDDGLLKRYVNNNAEDIFLKIASRIDDLEVMLKLDPNLRNKKYRPDVRLKNLLKLLTITILFIKQD